MLIILQEVHLNEVVNDVRINEVLDDFTGNASE